MNALTIRLCRTAGILLMGCWLSACGPQQLPPGLVYCSEGNPESFNPQLVTSGTTIDATSHQLYNRLVDYDDDSGKIVPGLAKAWHVSADGLSYRFELRKGVNFHSSKIFTPSRTLNADDVLFSFHRILDEDHPYHYVSRSGYPFFQSIDFADLVTSVTKLDDYRIEFHLSRPDASFLANLATDFAVILSREYAMQLLRAGTPEKLDQLAIGTGPFRLVEYVKNEYIRYRRHEGYWGKIPEIEMLVFDITSKSTVRLSKLITGDCSVSALPKAGELTRVSEHPQLVLDETAGLNVAFWAFNTQKQPFNDVRVRRALSHAIDKQNILRAVYQNSAIEAKGILPPTSWAYNSDAGAGLEFSPEKARQLLTEAGIDKLTIDIWAMPVARAYNPNALKTAELIQADLAKIGVKVNIISYDWSVFSQKLSHSDYDSVLIGWNADNSDPDNFFTPLLSCASVESGSNRSRWCNTEFDAMVRAAKAINDIRARTALYHEAEAMLAEQAPMMSFAHAKRMLLKSDQITGMHLSAFGGISFDRISIKSDKEQAH
ncbi:ABC transporter substrate-binding protein [Shewanella cyperi]|uniref:ABC transporter substrate-binding protein n=1 Tax=Shewanella cyperi TaxID=2814292 RepID=A0A974XMP7_9GAMM|nr:ABC transporter substrate-binding protein [Shewanella cyperi]